MADKAHVSLHAYSVLNRTCEREKGESASLNQQKVHQLLLSLGVRPPVIRRMRSTNHQMPRPPRVSSFPTAVPVCPRQNRSTPKHPRKNEYSRVVMKQCPVYLNKSQRKTVNKGNTFKVCVQCKACELMQLYLLKASLEIYTA